MKKTHLFKLNVLTINLCMALAGFAGSAYAEEPALELEEEYTFLDAIKDGKNLTNFRLRYEHVSQDGLAAAPVANRELRDAEGVTLRSLVGWQTAPFHNFSFAGQLIGVTKFVDNFNDRKDNRTEIDKARYAVIVDPNHFDINQLYVDWTGIKNTRVRLGRQQTILDNSRFIGDIGFRQVMQVFDGVSILNKSIPDTEVFLAHYEQVTQITTSQRDGDLEILNVKYRISPTEYLVGYGYLSNFDDLGFGNGWFGAGTLNNNGRPNLTADQSNKTIGIRLDGVHPFNPNLRALYSAEYAKQTDYADGDSRIDAHYAKLGGGVGIDNFSIRLDHEVLSSNDNEFAFQTPYGTNHLFQGWVDRFLVTPRSGIADTFLTATYKYGDFLFFADYHIINSDEDFNTVGGGARTNGDTYGKEWNASVTYNVNSHLWAKLEYGNYKESDQYQATATTSQAARIRDSDRLWLTAMYTF
ncbi:MAG: hypothetical protein CTY37_06345 [Methylotenera sp.]|nr:MAG: hypothetical protein CTY37_06345 [Methylotenera sp.]